MKIRINKNIASLFGAFLFKMLGSTLRIRYRGVENLEKARSLSGGVIFAFWHGRMILLSMTHRGSGVHVLASENYDGDLMGRIVKRLGFGHIRGSSSRGGARAVREMKEVLGKGGDIALTVDGPRGPRGSVQQGAIGISRLAGCAILPVSCAASRRKVLGSWDRMLVPAPFSVVTIEYGRPFVTGRGDDEEVREKKRSRLRETLNSITSELDRDAGHSGPGVWPHEDN